MHAMEAMKDHSLGSILSGINYPDHLQTSKNEFYHKDQLTVYHTDLLKSQKGSKLLRRYHQPCKQNNLPVYIRNSSITHQKQFYLQY